MARKSQHQPAAGAVAEIQGLYGPFSFPEKLLQKIWLRGDFDGSAARTVDGRRVSILHAGRWNLLGGPDFRGARLRFDDGPEVTGDVEIHLHAEDWAAHAHARDRAYDGVVLHVVLFPPEARRQTRGADGREIPVLVLLPLLHHDLEQFAAEEAVEALAGRTGEKIPDELAALSADELATLLQMQANERWRQKVHFARLRIQRLGWEAACHQTALEILGYRFNRAPMLRLASRWPLAAWRKETNADEIFATERDGWNLHGVRPANHPRTRVRQYAAWVRACGDWPEQLRALAARLPEVLSESETKLARRAHGLAALRKKIAALCGGAISGTRLDNVMCDGFLPLLAALSGSEPEALSWSNRLHGLWFHWWPGDLPPRIARSLRQLGEMAGRRRPASHGAAQGLLGWLLAHDSRG